MYEVRLILRERLVDRKPKGAAIRGVVLNKLIQLPFVPVVGTGLGLLEDSDFCFNHFEVERMMYVTKSNLFLVELKNDVEFEASRESDFWNHIQWHISEGWRLELGVAFDDEEECEKCDGTCTVQIGNLYYSLDEDSVRVLMMEKTPHKVMHTKE